MTKQSLMVQTESKEPLLGINKAVQTNRNTSTKLTGSFNALIPHIQQIAKNYQQLTSQTSPKSKDKK